MAGFEFATATRIVFGLGALDQVGVDWRPAGALPDALLRPRTGAAPSLVLVREVPITGVGVEGFYTMSIDLGAPCEMR